MQRVHVTRSTRLYRLSPRLRMMSPCLRERACQLWSCSSSADVCLAGGRPANASDWPPQAPGSSINQQPKSAPSSIVSTLARRAIDASTSSVLAAFRRASCCRFGYEAQYPEHGGLRGAEQHGASVVPAGPNLTADSSACRLRGWLVDYKSKAVFDYIDPTCPNTPACLRFFGWLR